MSIAHSKLFRIYSNFSTAYVGWQRAIESNDDFIFSRSKYVIRDLDSRYVLLAPQTRQYM